MNIYVGNLPLELTDNELLSELRKEFSVFGVVNSVNLRKDTFSGSRQPRLYAFVEMDSKTEGENAVFNLQGKEIGGRELIVISALPLSNEKERMPYEHRRGRPRHRFQGHQA